MSETQPRSHVATEPRTSESRRPEATPCHASGTRAKARGGKKGGGGGEREGEDALAEGYAARRHIYVGGDGGSGDGV